jgi:ureidoglycolate lyase
MFIPLSACKFDVVVARGDSESYPATVHASITDGSQGVNYAASIWHHPVIALDAVMDFLVIGRKARAMTDDFNLAAFSGGVGIGLS